MKPIMIFLCSFLFISLFSQSPCGLGYSFSSFTSGGGCHYTFTPIIPLGAPSIDYYEWEVSSYGTYGRTCDSGLEGNPLYYTFCFYGNHVVKMIIYFTGGGSCYVSQTIYVTCANALPCNPDVLNNSIPDPEVEITYIDPCSPFTGWHWAIRVPENQYNCEIFTYKIEYSECDGSGITCYELTPGTIYCVEAEYAEPITIMAYGNHCCLPANYTRMFSWTPVPGGLGLLDPKPYFSEDCADRCTIWYDPDCEEQKQSFYYSDIYPTLSCFNKKDTKMNNLKTGNKKITIESTSIKNDLEILNKYSLSKVSIIDTYGKIIFNGKWSFNNQSLNGLKWPEGIGPGIYIVRFAESINNESVKVFKSE